MGIKRLDPFSVAIKATERYLSETKKKIDEIDRECELYLDFDRRAKVLGSLSYEIGRLEAVIECGSAAEKKKAKIELDAKESELIRLHKFDLEKSWAKEEAYRYRILDLEQELSILNRLKEQHHRRLFQC